MKVQGSIRGPQWKVNQGSIFRIVRNTIKIDLPGFQPKSLTSGRCFVEKTAFLGYFWPFLGRPRGAKMASQFFFVLFIIPYYPREHLHFKVSHFIAFSPNDDQFCMRKWVSTEIAILSINQK